MTKCSICGHESARMMGNSPELIVLVMNTIDQDVLYENQPDPCEWDCCELCWYATVNNGMGFMWNGVNLMVWDREEEEFIEPDVKVWRPASPVWIQFEKDENGKWEVKAA